MKILFFILSLFIFANIANAQAANNDGFELKAFVGREGLDTMTMEEFFKYGKVELNSEKLKVNSFDISWVGVDCSFCDWSFRVVKGDSFNTDWLREILKKANGKMLRVVFSEVSFYSVKGKRNKLNKNLQIILRD